MKKILLLLTIVLFSCNKDEVQPIQEQEQEEIEVTITKYKLHIKAVPVYSNVRFNLYDAFPRHDVEPIGTVTFNRNVLTTFNYEFKDETMFYAFFSYNPEAFTMEEYTLTKYYSDGTSEIIEQEDNILYSNSMFYDWNLNNKSYKYFSRNLDW